MPLITKIELKNGTIYELGKTWPVRDQKEGSKGAFFVGLLWFCPGEEDDEGSLTFPAHYEAWCVPVGLLENFFTPVQKALFKGDPNELEVWKQQLFAHDLVTSKIIYRRNIFLSQVACDEESWWAESGLKEIVATVVNPTFAPDEEEEGLPPQVVPVNGEQKSAESEA